MFRRVEGATQFLDPLIGPFPKLLKDFRIFGIICVIDQFIGVFFKIMQKFGIMINVANIFVGRSPNSLVSRDSVTNCKVLMKGIRAPVFWHITIDDWFETPAVKTLW